MNRLLLDLALSRRIELAEAQAAVEAAENLMQRRPESGAAREKIAGGYAVYTGPDSHLTQAVGVGLDGPVSEEEFNRLEEFYRSRNEPVRVETSPLADMSLFERFGKRGYIVTEFTNVMARPVHPKETWPAPPNGISIEKAEYSRVDLWTLAVAQGFSEHFPVSQEIIEVMRMFAEGPHTECYLAYLEGNVAGGGTLTVHQGVAGLFGASTLPPFRNRGVQTALLQKRLARAAALGAEIAVSLARPGSTSQRNIVRQGFEILYTRVKFERDWK